METKRNKSTNSCPAGKKEEDVEQFPGVAIDCADDEKVDPRLIKERTKTLNNNPRDTDL